MADELRINGIAHSWGSCRLKIDSDLYTGVTSITFGDKLEVAKGYGMGKEHKPRARSRGKYTTDQLVMKVQTSTAQAIRDQLAGDGGSYGTVEVEIVLQYIEPNDNPMTAEFEECRLVEDTSSDEEGSDVLSVELKWDIMGIRRNGKTLYEE